MRLNRRQFIGLLGALGLTRCARTKPFLGSRDARDTTFAAINDLHVLDMRSTSIVNRAVHQINDDERIAFTVVLGDIATDGKLTELKLARTALDHLERPWFAVPGNHDVDMTSANIFGNYERTFELGNWREDEWNWAFVGFDSCEEAKSDVTVRPDRIEWLQQVATKIKPDRPIALFAHHPFNPNTKAYRVINAEEVLAIFAGHNLKLVACGHYHGNQVEERDGVLFTTTACCSTTRGNFDETTARGYRLFHLDGEDIETEFVEVPM